MQQKYKLYGKELILIELLETGEKVSLYSPRFEGEEYTEFEKFLLTYKDQYAQDVRLILSRKMVQKIDSSDMKEANVTG